MSQSTNRKKTIEVVAGSNGSGKTTFAESFFQNTVKNSIYLNPDVIASGFSKNDFQQASYHAGRILLSEIKNRIANDESFVFESTLSGRTYFGILNDAKNQGFSVHIYFLMLDDVQLNLARIKERVQLGGHDIPTDAVLRRHRRCFENFWNLYSPICDDWFIFDNSQKIPILKMSFEDFSKLNEKQRSSFEQNFLSGKLP